MKHVRLPTTLYFVSIYFIENNKSKTKFDLVPPKPIISDFDIGRDFIYILWEIGNELVYINSFDAFLNQTRNGSTTANFYKYPTLLPNRV